jgi:hypothetical protein
MGKAWWLLFLAALLGVWNAGIVWFTQIAVYPLWPLVGPNEFHDYHLAWWHDMWPSFGPVIAMLVCSIVLLYLRPHGIPVWVMWTGLLLQITVHILTALFWAPLQAELATSAGISFAKYRLLMSTHWLRVGFFFAYAILMIWALQKFTVRHSEGMTPS